jgi:predicted enzyme related to lactoylglutathione lyase
MDYTLEIIVVPVTDVDRAMAFYSEKTGFNVDVDFSAGGDSRIGVAQLQAPHERRAVAGELERRWVQLGGGAGIAATILALAAV